MDGKLRKALLALPVLASLALVLILLPGSEGTLSYPGRGNGYRGWSGEAFPCLGPR